MDDLHVVETRDKATGKWRLYDAHMAVTSAERSLSEAKKAWPDDEWRISVYRRVEDSATPQHTVTEGKP